MKKFYRIITIIFLFILYIYVTNVNLIPDNIILLENENIKIKKLFGIQMIETAQASSENCNTISLDVTLFGVIPLKEVTVTKIEDIEVVPVGKIIGLKLYINGVLVVGLSEIEDMNNNLIRPYEQCDIKEGDSILKINDADVECIKDLKEVVNNSKGKNLNVTLLRDGNIINSNILPVKTSNKEYKLGLWVKDAATGVGTITFYEPKSKSFAVLGHGINDNDTGNLINIDYGELVTSRIISIKKGENGNPGEVRGTILNQKKIGNVFKNTQFGIYGTMENLTSINIDSTKTLKVASRDEIKQGEAKILCAIDNDNIAKEYSIEIEKIYLENNSTNKSMLIRVTDENLINATGGIIRGLSGAPIIQNGKFIGAVTNVLVSNPEIGYGIFGDLMIKEMNSVD